MRSRLARLVPPAMPIASAAIFTPYAGARPPLPVRAEWMEQNRPDIGGSDRRHLDPYARLRSALVSSNSDGSPAGGFDRVLDQIVRAPLQVERIEPPTRRSRSVAGRSPAWSTSETSFRRACSEKGLQ
jgi:hypothetical protein